MAFKKTIGNRDATPFAERGTGKSMDDWGNLPLASQGGQRYGYGVTPQTMVGPKRAQFKAGCNPKHLDVERPSGRKDPQPPQLSYGVPILGAIRKGKRK